MLAAKARFLALAAVTAVVAAAFAVWGLGPRRGAPERPSSAAVAALPIVALAPDVVAEVTRIALTAPGAAGGGRTIVLERRGAGWRLRQPIEAAASADKVEALLRNLQDLRVWRRLDAGTSYYARYALGEGQALHVVVQAGSGPARRAVVDFFAGLSSEQGQLVRLPGTPGLFALINRGPHGYQGFLYTRDLRSWRDPAVLAFDEADVDAVEIAGAAGRMAFTRHGSTWSGTLARRRHDGTVGAPRPWAGFDAGRVDAMLRAFHALAADDFGDPSARASAGLDRAELTGGILRVHLAAASRTLVLRVGGPAATGSRFSLPGSRWAATEGQGDDGALYALSPWTARWVVAGPTPFEARR